MKLRIILWLRGWFRFRTVKRRMSIFNQRSICHWKNVFVVGARFEIVDVSGMDPSSIVGEEALVGSGDLIVFVGY